jgi:inosine-uridine nucleoside N-ribohydrolase
LKIVAITVCGAGSVSPAVIKSKIDYDLKYKYAMDSLIPVYAGADRPYIDYQKELKDEEIYDSYNYEKTDYSIFQEEVKKKSSEKIDINTKISNMAAVKIAELVRTHEKNLNILTLGPLTNVSLAVLIDYSIKDKFNNLFIVGGSYHNLGNSGNSAEYNFRVDPVAAKNVIHYYKNITLIPLEVEEHLKSGGIGNLKTNCSVLNKFFDHLSEETEESRSRHSFLGLFGAIVAVNPKTQKTINIRPTDVDIIGRYTRGSLAIEKYDHLKSGKFKEIKIVEDVDVESFINILKESLIQ